MAHETPIVSPKLPIEALKSAITRCGIRLLPTPTDGGPQELAQSASWGPFIDGEYVTISVSANCHLKTGPAAVIATLDDVFLPLGIHDFVWPAGVTHIAIISAMVGARALVWRS